jgi:sodium-dependent dicarboxylate transporter 2/3/5
LFSGGLAAGNLILSTGAADAAAQAVEKLQLHNAQLLLALFLVLGIFFANTSSNTAAVAVLIPVVIGVASRLKLDPLPFVYAASAACNAAFALPTSIRLFPSGTGWIHGSCSKKVWRRRGFRWRYCC